MEDKNLTTVEEQQEVLPTYEAPTIITFTDNDIMEELGPAQANEYSVGTSIM